MTICEIYTKTTYGPRCMALKKSSCNLEKNETDEFKLLKFQSSSNLVKILQLYMPLLLYMVFTRVFHQ